MSDVFAHPWLGALFGDDEGQAIWSADRQLQNILSVEAALTHALAKNSGIDVEEVTAAVLRFEADRHDLAAGTARDGLPIPALVSQLRSTVSQPDLVHTGATSQDIMDTALALTLRDTNVAMIRKLDGLLTALDALERSFGDNPLMGRTRMQAAVPITVGRRLRSWSEPLRDQVQQLDTLRPRVEALQLGGAVGTRKAFGNDAGKIAAHMADRLDLTDAGCWHTTRDAVVQWADLCARITGVLGKMGQDVCLMAQQGIDEIAMDGGGSSSAMPHKQNPVTAELLVTLARYSATQIAGMHHALIHEQERSGAAWMLEWMILPGLAQATLRSVTAATDVCGRITRIGTP